MDESWEPEPSKRQRTLRYQPPQVRNSALVIPDRFDYQTDFYLAPDDIAPLFPQKKTQKNRKSIAHLSHFFVGVSVRVGKLDKP